MKKSIAQNLVKITAPYKRIIDIVVAKICPFLPAIFCIGYALVIISTLTTNIPIIMFLSSYIGLAGTAILTISVSAWVWKSKNNSELILYALLLLISGLSYYYGRTAVPLKLCLLCFGIYHYNFRQCVKVQFYVQLTCTILVVFLSLIGITQTNTITREDSIRYDYGFGHPNIFGMVISMLIIEKFYLDYHKNKICKRLNICIAILFCIFNYFLVDSRASLILLIGATLIYILPSHYLATIIKYKSVRKVLCNTFLILSIVTIVFTITIALKWQIGYSMNAAFSGRLSLYNSYLQKYAPTLLGINLKDMIENKHQALDSIYLASLLRYGIILFIFYLILSKRCLSKLLRNKKYFSASIFALLLFYGAMETLAINPGYNIFILLLNNGLEPFIHDIERLRHTFKKQREYHNA